MENPEDIFSFLDSAGDNVKRFSLALNRVAKDWGGRFFDQQMANLPKGLQPFEEIQAYRDALVHDSVLGRGVEVAKVFLPKWCPPPSVSPLERVAASWSKASQLRQDELIEKKALFIRISRELFELINGLWSTALHAIDNPAAVAKLARAFTISNLGFSAVGISGLTTNSLSASGAWIISEEPKSRP